MENISTNHTSRGVASDKNLPVVQKCRKILLFLKGIERQTRARRSNKWNEKRVLLVFCYMSRFTVTLRLFAGSYSKILPARRIVRSRKQAHQRGSHNRAAFGKHNERNSKYRANRLKKLLFLLQSDELSFDFNLSSAFFIAQKPHS